MQRSNWIVFILLSAAAIAGWYVLHLRSRPTPDPDAEKKKLAQADKDKKKDDDKSKEAVKTKSEIKTKTEVKTKAEKKEDKDKTKVEGKDKQPQIKAEEKKVGGVTLAQVDVEPDAKMTLGGEGYHLTVVTTARGAGVRQVILNRFKAADWHGRPIDRKLEIIQDDNFAPSFRMYHYADPGDDHPLLGLGEKTWAFEGREESDDFQEIRYSTNVPATDHVKIVKTYRLAPKEYHVTLTLEFIDTRKPGATATPLRYQLTGGQALPIEGEYFAATFRNAIALLVDGSGLHRNLQDSLTISNKRGGDTWPEDKYSRGQSRLQYAGIANQYFAVVTAVDNKQPEKGPNPDKVLGWSRPTLESREKKGFIKAIAPDRKEVIFLANTPVLKVNSELTAKDKESTKRPGSYMKVHEVRLARGFGYSLELASKDFAGCMILEDADKNILAEAVAPGDGLPVKLDFRAPYDGAFRIIATSVQADEKGAYALNVREQSANYRLLPRTKKHFADLELEEDQQVTLSYYTTPEGWHVASWVRLGSTPKPQFDDITMRVNSEKFDLPSGDTVAHRFLLYHGPVKAALLGQFRGDKEVPSELVEKYTDTLHMRTLTDYRSDVNVPVMKQIHWVWTNLGLTRVIIWFTSLMHSLLNLLHLLLGWIPGSYGLSIILLTVLVRAAMFPISRKMALFSIKMQELAPELQKISEKYKEDPAGLIRARNELMGKHGISMFGGCLPVFLQIPIFMGLYFALQESIHFRLAGFAWVTNLAAPDMLLYWTEKIPLISSPDAAAGFLGFIYLGPYLNVLPIIAVVFMMIQQSQTMPPATNEQEEMRNKMMKYMPIIFAVMFYKVAAGLCIYFIVSSVWGVAERKLLPKKKPATAGTPTETPSGLAAPASAAPTPPPKWKGKSSKKDKGKEKEAEPTTAMEKIKAWWREILEAAKKK